MAGVAIVLDLVRKSQSRGGQTLHSHGSFSAAVSASAAAASVAAAAPFAARALFGYSLSLAVYFACTDKHTYA